MKNFPYAYAKLTFAFYRNEGEKERKNGDTLHGSRLCLSKLQATVTKGKKKSQ
jgi:hypothetical protein